MKKSRTCKRSSGFTLIELLIVVAILLVLGAVIFAGATKIREKADAAKSMGNLRQLTGIHHAFTVDKGFIVNQNDTTIGGRKLHWSEWLAIEVTGNEESKSWDATLAKGQGMFADGAAYRKASGKIKNTVGHNAWRSYCYNNTVGALDPEAASDGANKGWTKGALTPLQVTHPSKLLLFSMRKFADGEGRFIPYMNRVESDQNMDSVTHKGVIFASFFDGHVETISPVNWPDNNGTRADTGKAYTQPELNQYWWGREVAVGR